MRKLFILSALLVSLAISGAAYAWTSTGGDGSDYGQIQETAVFFNNSGVTLWTGAVVIIDLSGTNVTTGTTLGAYVTLSATADNSDRKVMGVVKIAADDQTPVVVITKGVAHVSYDSSNAALTLQDTIGQTVGSGGVRVGYADGGETKLGFLLNAPVVVDQTEVYIWVNPHGSE